jgi:hypothetical protein
MVPYEALRSALYERRIELYDHAPLLAELRALEHDRMRGKVEHPVAGGKDCIAGATPIMMLDGRVVPIQALVGQEFLVYACNEEGSVVPAWAHDVRQVGVLPMVRVWLERGAYVDCTPDHEILREDGTFCEAQHLRVGERLMPLYRWESLKHTRFGSEQRAHRMRVCRVERVEAIESGPVFDMTVEVHHNFAIAAGIFVHNCADAVAGVVAGLMKKVPRVPLGVLQPGEGRAAVEDLAWVTGQPAGEGEAEMTALPFLMG